MNNENKTKSLAGYSTFRLLKMPIVLAGLVTLLRITLEYVGAPEGYIFVIGLLWLTLALAVYWAHVFYKNHRAYRTLCLLIVLFGPISRIFVVLAWWVDRQWELKTHYGLFFETWPEALWNQLFYGSLVQIIPGICIGTLAIRILKANNNQIKSKPHE